MKQFRKILKATQEQLFEMLCREFRSQAIINEGGYILVGGNAPVMLLAHLDTVHAEPVKELCATADGNILMSPQGIGGDDRCGVYALNKCYAAAKEKPYLLFTCDEEIGGIGANQFCTDFRAGLLPAELEELKLLVEIDRKGSSDAVYYDCYNPTFKKYISSKGFVTAYGSFSDISVIAPELNTAAVNLSSGYYNPHTLHEFIKRRELETTINKVNEIISDAAQKDFPKFEYLSSRQFLYKFSAEVPDDLPKNYADIFLALLDSYDAEELNCYRQLYGNEFLIELFRKEFENY